MAQTIVGVNHPRAVKRWSGLMAYDISHKSFFEPRFMARGANAEVPIQILTDLEADEGEMITYELLAELRMAPIEGDDILEGREEAQRAFTDQVWIDQARVGVNKGSRMTRKRTLNYMRETEKRQQSNWWARMRDELLFMYLSGSRGVNPNFLFPLGYTGRPSSQFTAPTPNQHFFGGNATAFSNITTADRFTLRVIDRAKTRADTQGGGASNLPVLQPCNMDGHRGFICIMHPFQEDDLRADAGAGGWIDITRALTTAEGRNSPFFKDALGYYRGVVLHKHRNVIRFNNAGAGANVEAARALFLGAQAAVVAYGSAGKDMRYDWHEETRDNGDKLVISSSSIFGIKKVTWNMESGPQDFGAWAIDTAAASR